MSTQPRGRSKEARPRVGILAPTHNIATSLAQELGITNHVPLSPRSLLHSRGTHLSALLVDETLWPMQPDVAEALVPTLSRTGGYILRVLRVDPKAKARPRP
jgi:hypothetical protein